jgi:phosphoglycerol transferase
VFVYLLLPLAVLLSDLDVNRRLMQRLVPDAYDRAGICAKQCLPPGELPKVIVAGPDVGGILRTQFLIDNPQVTTRAVPPGGVCDMAALPPDREWVIVVGEHLTCSKTAFEKSMNGFTLARIRRGDTVDLRK